MNRKGFTLIELLVVITIIGILIALALPNFIKAKDKALEAEVQSNIHSLQISLERYATDNGGFYPAYIFGGDIASWTNGGGFGQLVTNTVHDPLILFGYFTSSPRNPFMKDARSLCLQTGIDPRFGCQSAPAPCSIVTPCGGDLMGNILSDPTYGLADNVAGSLFGSLSPGPATPGGVSCTGMPAGGRCAWYFIGDDDSATVDFIPGEFLYRSYGTSTGLIKGLPTPSGIIRPFVIDHFMLGGYGSPRTAGRDILHCWSIVPTTNGIRNNPSTNPTGQTYFDNPRPGTVIASDGCREAVRPNGAAFNASLLWQNEPSYGGVCYSGALCAPVASELPNIVMTPARGPVAVGTDLAAPNPDGRTDGVIVWFTAGLDQATSGGT
jgi:prepilin-type N-terminal cleavage/methylation domain-containing protein